MWNVLAYSLLALYYTEQGSASPFAHVQTASKRTNGLSMPLTRNPHSIRKRGMDDDGLWAARQRNHLIGKYGGTKSSNSKSKRAGSGYNALVNMGKDSSYYGSIAIGTPAVAYDVIVDTGSADLWLAGSSCTTGCDNVPAYIPSNSASFTNMSTSWSITYGSGAVTGYLASEKVQMAGFEVTDQPFAVANQVSDNFITSPVSGLLGLAFSTIATSGEVPFWENLVKSGSWEEPVMTFYLTRFLNNTRADSQEPGGRFDLGFIDSSLYTGDIEYTDIPTGQERYWTIPISAVTVNGASVTIPSTDTSNAAIDTGTTLVGAPPDVVANIFAAIEGSAPATGNYEGYYTFPCDTSVTVALSFGGRAWSMSPDDFSVFQTGPNECIGAIFEISTNSNGPSWIIGDSFLKNVYSVFRYNPASVGFATLSQTALDIADVNGALPSPTIGTNPIVAEHSGALSLARGLTGLSIALAVGFISGLCIL